MRRISSAPRIQLVGSPPVNGCQGIVLRSCTTAGAFVRGCGSVGPTGFMGPWPRVSRHVGMIRWEAESK